MPLSLKAFASAAERRSCHRFEGRNISHHLSVHSFLWASKGFAYPLWLYEEDCTRSQATEKAQRVRFQADMKSPACASQEEKNKPVDLRLSQPGEVSAAAVHSNSRRRDCGRSFLLQAIAVRPTTQTCQMEEQQRKRRSTILNNQYEQQVDMSEDRR
ncbi:uncharacterized protein [Chiloscyllium punctatum]|uniref:uncharacterized protein isoform X2 n=1 Tax=Chiloscyllium punctatum TaxID=137246 RepID=UPI003B63E5DA